MCPKTVGITGELDYTNQVTTQRAAGETTDDHQVLRRASPTMTTLLLSVSSNDFTTTTTYMNTTERPWQSFPFYVAAKYIWMICPVFILLFGTFGNIMIMVIMRQTKSGESAIHLYFIATAVFDMIVLWTYTMVEWLTNTSGFDVRTTHDAVCKIITWLFSGSGTVSVWCLVCMTVHRAMSVVWPHRVNVLCTRRTVLRVLTGFTVFFALLYSHYLIGFENVFVASANNHQCTIRDDNEDYLYFFGNIFFYIELSVYSLVPFIVLVVANSVLVGKLTLAVRAAKRKLTQGDSEQVQSREKAANSVTLTIIVVSVAFIVLTFPNAISFMLYFLNLKEGEAPGYELAKRAFIFAICNLSGHTNLAVNFYLYCLTGRRFREEFIKVMCCGRNRRCCSGPHQ